MNKQTRNKFVKIRVTQEERELIKNWAQETGKTVSELIRETLIKKCAEAGLDLE